MSGWQPQLTGLGSPRVRRDLGKPRQRRAQPRGGGGSRLSLHARGRSPSRDTPGRRCALSPEMRYSLRLPVLAGHLAGLLAAGPACADAYRGLSDCVLKLGDSMATYEEEEGIELQGLRRVCR